MDLEELVQAEEVVFFEEEIIQKQSLMNFIPFVSPDFNPPYHLKEFVDDLEAMIFRGEKQLMTLSAPPQHFKTTTLEHAVALLIYLRPKTSVVLMSYNFTYASDRVMNIIEILNKLGIEPHPMKKGKSGYRTKDGASITPAGIATGYTGRPADLAIIDDPVRTLDDVLSVAHNRSMINTFEGVVDSREQNESSIIVTHTRWHKGDLIGWIMKNRDKYKHINIPVITDGVPLLPSKLNLEMIETKQKELGDAFKAMYMGQPPDSINQVFRSDGVQYYSETPKEYQSFAIGGDLAYTDKSRADFTAIVYMYKANDKYYIENVERWQRDFNYTRSKLKEVYQAHDTPIQLEYNGVQKGIVDTLISDGLYINKQKIENSKYTRSLDFASQWNLGNVLLKKAEWNEWYIKELLDFTGSGKEHDDCVDASVYAFRGLQSSFAFA